MDLALSSENITKIGIVVIIALVVIGLLLSIVITKLIGRVLILLVVVGLGIAVWQQRTHIENQVNKHACNLDARFFGFHLDPPDSVKQACDQKLH